LKIEIITEESKFLALAPVWNPLLQRSRADVVFLTFEWLSTWWRHFGKGNQLFVVVLKEAEQIVALAPLMVTTRDGFRHLTIIGGHTSEYKDFIIRDDVPLESTIEAILQTVLGEKCWDFFKVDGLREDSPSLDSLKTMLPHQGRLKATWYENDVSPYILIDQPWEGYWGSLKSSTRNDCARRMKMLSREIGEATYHWPKDFAEVDHYLDELIKLHLDRRREVTRTFSVFESSLMVDFYKDLTRELFERQWLSLPALLVNGEIAAIHFGFEYGNKYFYYMPTFNQKFTKYSPAKALLFRLLNDAFTRGLKEFDFLLGNEPYKFDFKPEVRKLYSVAFFQSGVRGRASQLWFSRVRPRAEALVNNHKSFEQLKWWFRRRKSQQS
jgi:CelD/BcsL family acetyltransferase involved in cellulose biosynthesis